MNNLYCGNLEDFAPIVEEGSRVVISYDLQQGEEGLSTWREITFYTKQGKPTMEAVKKAIIADINKQTDEKIINGFVWEGINVWLSEENQRNFSEAQRIASTMPDAILPVKFKLGEDAEGNPVYHTFESAEELTEFYVLAVNYINQCLEEGWAKKDGIDWSVYESVLNPQPKKSKKSKQ